MGTPSYIPPTQSSPITYVGVHRCVLVYIGGRQHIVSGVVLALRSYEITKFWFYGLLVGLRVWQNQTEIMKSHFGLENASQVSVAPSAQLLPHDDEVRVRVWGWAFVSRKPVTINVRKSMSHFSDDSYKTYFSKSSSIYSIYVRTITTILRTLQIRGEIGPSTHICILGTANPRYRLWQPTVTHVSNGVAVNYIHVSQIVHWSSRQKICFRETLQWIVLLFFGKRYHNKIRVRPTNSSQDFLNKILVICSWTT